MKTISLAMIVKDEEAVLARCLDCVKEIADEIIIVDTGSRDQTMEIAKAYHAKLYPYAWKDDFAAARNYAFSFAKMEYTMWLDADDIITEENQKKLLEWKHNDAHPDIVMMKYHTGFDEEGIPVFTYERERLMKTACHFQWVGAIHEAITPQGEISYVDIAICHHKEKINDPDRNLRIFEQQLHLGKALSPREQYYYARELYYHKRYDDAIAQFDIFLTSKQGWFENCIDACRMTGACYREKGEYENALRSLFESFFYDTPRAELLCDIAFLFYERNDFIKAIHWYQQALSCEIKKESGAFIQVDCYRFIPYLQLSVCYERIHAHTLACEYHQKAKAIKPHHPLIIKNDPFFAQ